MKLRRAVVLSKIEAVYGTDSVPAAATNGLLVSDLDTEPLAAEAIRRNTVQPYLGSRQEILAGVHGVIQFGIEAAGAGAAGTAPKYGPELRACGHAETISAGVDVQYAPVSANEEAVTNYIFHDGQKHPFLGCRGTMELMISAKQLPMLKFRKLGMYVAPTSVANPAPDLSGFQVPKVVSKVNTPTFTLHGFAGKLHSFALNQGNATAHRDLPGEESVQIGDRLSVGQIVIEEPPIATKDFFAIAKASTLGVLQIIHGTAAGNIFQFDGSNVQLKAPRRQNVDGISMLAMQLVFVPSATGDDEYKITVK